MSSLSCESKSSASKTTPTFPLVITGNKSDLEKDGVVSRQTTCELSHCWENAPYYEASARRRANVDEVFMEGNKIGCASI
jgi:Ras-related protein Rap-1B